MPRQTFPTIRRAPWVDPLIEGFMGAGLLIAALVSSLVITAIVAITAPDYWCPAMICALFILGAAAISLETKVKLAAGSPGSNRGTVVVGNEGVVICTSLRRHVISFSELESVEEHAGHFAVFTSNRARVRVRVDEFSTLVSTTQDALQRYRNRTSAATYPSLSRGGDRVEKWLRRLYAAETGAGYRTEAITPDLLIQVVKDPGADREQRIGAAARLHGSPKERLEGIRVSIEGTADEHLASALELALDGSTDEAPIKRALKPG